MKLLYIAAVYIDYQHPDGVAKKILNHYEVFMKNFDSWLIHYDSSSICIAHGKQRMYYDHKWNYRRYALYNQAQSLIQKEKIDCVYIRYPKSDYFFIHLLKSVKCDTRKIVIEIATYPYNGNLSLNFKILAIACIDYVFREQLKKYVDCIITYSDDSSIFGIPTIQTINGVLFSNIPIVGTKKQNHIISLISVATNYSCHGFDRIILGMEKYYLKGGTQEFIFRIVGDGPAIATYQKQLSNCRFANKRVFLCGFQTGEELTYLYNQSDIAVNSLALYRIGLTKESTLKTKEYAAKGLPMISSTEVDALDEMGNQKYVLLVEDSNDAIDMDKIINFYKTLRLEKSREELAREIRCHAEKICDMNITLRDIKNFFIGENNVSE